MRNLLAFLAAAVLAFAALGWYLDWYKIKSEPTGEGHRHVNIDFNEDKILDDVHKGVENGEKKLERVLEKDKNRPEDKSKTGDNARLPDNGPTSPAKSVPQP